jgi:hypothetical protein
MFVLQNIHSKKYLRLDGQILYFEYYKQAENYHVLRCMNSPSLIVKRLYDSPILAPTLVGQVIHQEDTTPCDVVQKCNGMECKSPKRIETLSQKDCNYSQMF